MSKEPHPGIFPPCRPSTEEGAILSTVPVRPPVGSDILTPILSPYKSSEYVGAPEENPAASFEQDRPWCPLPSTTPGSDHVSDSSDTATENPHDNPAIEKPHIERPTGQGREEGQSLHPSLSARNLPIAAFSNGPSHDRAEQNAAPKPSGPACSTSIAGPGYSTSAHPFPPPSGPSEDGKSIWAPGWVYQPEEKWNENLGRTSIATVSPRTQSVGEFHGSEVIAQQRISTSGSLRVPFSGKKTQEVKDSRKKTKDTGYVPPKVALTAYLNKLADDARRKEQTSTLYALDERLTEPVHPPFNWDHGKKRVLRTERRSEHKNDVEMGDDGPSSNCQPNLANVNEILPRYAHLVESVGLNDNELPPLPLVFNSIGLPGCEQHVTASRRYQQFVGPPLAQPSQNTPAADCGLVSEAHNQATSNVKIHERQNAAATHITLAEANLGQQQRMSTNNHRQPGADSVTDSVQSAVAQQFSGSSPIPGSAAYHPGQQHHIRSHVPQSLDWARYVLPSQQSSVPSARQTEQDHQAPPGYLYESFFQSFPSRATLSSLQNQPSTYEPLLSTYTGQHSIHTPESQFKDPEVDLQYAPQTENAHGNHENGQGSSATPLEQSALQANQPYGQGALGTTWQIGFKKSNQGSATSSPNKKQAQGPQKQRQPRAQPIPRGRYRSWSAKQTHALQVPLNVPPDWNQNSGTTASTHAWGQYTGSVPQSIQQQAPYVPVSSTLPPFPTVRGSGMDTSSTMNRALAVDSNIRAPIECQYAYGPVILGQALPIQPYRPGSDTTFTKSAGGANMEHQELTRHGPVTFAEATSTANLPFVEGSRRTMAEKWGVIRIGNIPYSVTKQEIMGFLGRNAKIITPDLGGAIHIIMERSTSKTMDCYVEFYSYGDALAVVNKFIRNREDGRHPRVGDRHVAVEMSGQDALMKELFPRAKNVVWHGGNPTIVHSDEPYNSGFKSFVTSEEMVMVVKHAEQPHRSPFSQKCLQRTYECMISTLQKYPWWCVDLYTLADRDLLVWATEQQIKALLCQLKRGGAPGLTVELLTELVYAGLNAPGFSEPQKARLVAAAERVGMGIRLSPLAAFWPFEVLGRKEGVEEDVVEYYAFLLHKATTSSALVTLAQQSANNTPQTHPSPFGNVFVSWPADKGALTVAAAAAIEWEVLEILLRKVFGGAVDYSGAW